MTGIILTLYLMNEVPILMIRIFSHFAIEPRMFLDISDHGYEIEINWSFGGIVYFRCVLDSVRSIMLHIGTFLYFLRVSRSPSFTKLQSMIAIIEDQRR